ncbi:insulinase family protein [Vogesella fluminis]|uniref:M16 family metallopeptidase n=1 Tax=Vogesella fluminis TaxID=1069161 RepID=UPI003638637C
MPRLMRLSVLVWVLLSCPLRAAPIAVDPALIQGELANGLRYAILPTPGKKGDLELRLNVAAGSLHEAEWQRGLAHAVEHMAFKGSRLFPGSQLPGSGGLQVLEELGLSIGAHANAVTSYDCTRYKFSLTNASAVKTKLALQVLADWSSGLTMAPDAFEGERGVILEEWRMRRGLSYRLGLVQDAMRYAGSLYSHREVIGMEDVLRNAPVEQARAFYDAWYRPERMTVVVVGDVKVAEVKAMIDNAFGGIKSRAPLPALPPSTFSPRPALQVERYVDPENHRRKVVISWQRTLDASPDEGASVWRDWLEGHALRLLVRRLERVAQQPAAPIRAPRMVPGSVLIAPGRVEYQLSFEPVGSDAVPALQTVLTEIERLSVHGSFREELVTVIDEEVNNALAVERQQQDPATVADRLTESLHYRLPWLSPRQWRELHQQWAPKAAVEHVRAVWQSMDDLPMQVLQIARPDDPALDENDVAKIRASLKAKPPSPGELPARMPAISLPRPPMGNAVPIPRSGLPGFGQWRLSNGMKIQVLARPGFKGRAQLRATAAGGLTDESAIDRHMGNLSILLAERGGYAGMDSSLLNSWSRERQLDLSPFILSMQHGLSGSAPVARLGDLFALLSVKLRPPAIQQTMLDKIRQEWPARQRVEDAELAFTRFIYKNGLQSGDVGSEPTLDELQAMTVPKLLGRHRQLFGSRKDWMITVVGNVDPLSVVRLAETWLAGLEEEGVLRCCLLLVG